MQHSTALFRKEAIEGQKKYNLGEAILLPRSNHQYLTVALVFWFLLLGALLINANFSNKVSVSGWLVSAKASIDIMPNETGGIVKSTNIYNGLHVTKGQLLLEIERTAPSLSHSNVSQQVASLNAQYTLLEERQEILQNKYIQQLKLNDGLKEGYQKHLLLNANLLTKVKEQLKDAMDEEALLSSLIRTKNLSKATFNIQKEKRQSIELQSAQLQSAKLELEDKLQSTEQSRISNKLELEEALNALASKMKALKLELEASKMSRNYVIKSPIDGIVHNLQINSGETIHSQLPLMQITPLNTPLKARLYIPSNHIGFIEEGQLVQLRLKAFPYQKFGMAKAIVSQVSQQILLPHQVKNLPIQLSEPVFIVEAELSEQYMSANGTPVDLKAGMLLQANVTLAERSLLEWLLSPIYSLRGQF
ncbi:HlyD family secretion protein [Glaciecola sp. MF2-115]|uniref:HlyD family secretion protein n=1 Tax=Glaciecola sp. MF2-115 TaxID=3384827 RepID=UPI0039A1DB48